MDMPDNDQIKSFKDVKKELKALLFLNGYSKLLRTNSFFKKVFWLICTIPLFGYCMLLVYNNYMGYAEFNVVTQIKVVENETLSFPAITFCLYDLVTFISPNLSEVLKNCSFENTIGCSSNDFEYFEIYDPWPNANVGCYKFNGGFNASGQPTNILQSSIFGTMSGLSLHFNLTVQNFLFYFVGENKVVPVYTELNSMLQGGKFIYANIQAKKDIKLPQPYSKCIEDISSETSHLVEQILEQNITYRKTNCYDLCFKEYFSSRNISLKDAYIGIRFSYEGNCSHLCPLECQINQFEVSENTFTYPQGSFVSSLEIIFYYSQNKYTEIVQSVKTTETDLIANTGGVLGLFLEVTFISAYRLIVAVFDIIF